MKRFVLAAALAIAACSPQAPEPAPSQPGVTPSDAPPAAEPPLSSPPPSTEAALTSEGWGPLRAGMTKAEVIAAVGDTATPNAVPGADPEACSLFHPANAPADLFVMIEQGKLTRVSATRSSTLKTDRGFGIGDDAAAIKQAYGATAQSEPHKYQAKPAEYIMVWQGGPRANPYAKDPAARGIVYEIAESGKVSTIHAGGDSIVYVEGCS